MPAITRVFHRLRALGSDLPREIYTVEQAKAAVLGYMGKDGKANA